MLEESIALKILYQLKLHLDNEPLFKELKYANEELCLYAYLFNDNFDKDFHLYVDVKSDELYLSDHNELELYLGKYFDHLNETDLKSIAMRCHLNYNNGFSIKVDHSNISKSLYYYKDLIGLIMIEGN